MTINRREKIMEAAASSFALFGYKGTTMDQVAKIASVGKGTIYYFYKNKEELFNEIVHDLIAEVKNVANKALDHENPFLTNVHNVLEKVLDFRERHELMVRLSHEVKGSSSPVIQEALQTLENALLTLISREVQRAMDQGELKRGDPEITAFIMFKLYIALVYDWEKTHPPLEKEEIARLFSVYLAEGFAV